MPGKHCENCFTRPTSASILTIAALPSRSGSNAGSRRGRPVERSGARGAVRSNVTASCCGFTLRHRSASFDCKSSPGRTSTAYMPSSRTKISDREPHHVHVVLNACLGAAVRSGALAVNPMSRVLQTPSPGEANHGIALSDKETRRLLAGFRGSSIELIVVIAIRTGMRRNEILALRWSDLDVPARELKVERAIEKVGGKVTFKLPKTKRGLRAIAIDDSLLELLVAERKTYQRLIAGVADGTAVDLTLVKLPADALMFPSPAGRDLRSPRDDHAVTAIFRRRAARLGFGQLRFHDLAAAMASASSVKVYRSTCLLAVGTSSGGAVRSYAKAVDSDDKLVRDALKAIATPDSESADVLSRAPAGPN